jgi:hypothetical protein
LSVFLSSRIVVLPPSRFPLLPCIHTCTCHAPNVSSELSRCPISAKSRAVRRSKSLDLRQLALDHACSAFVRARERYNQRQHSRKRRSASTPAPTPVLLLATFTDQQPLSPHSAHRASDRHL